MEHCSAADRERFSTQSLRLEGAKQAAEFFGHRPRRYAVQPRAEGHDEIPAGVKGKRLHFIRHGEGHHNAWRAAEFAAGRTPCAKRHNIADVPEELFDPRLTEKGRDEARGAQAQAIKSLPQLLVTSPLRRAVETMLIAFEHAVAKGVPCIAHELCREEVRGTPPGQPSIYDAHLPRETLAKEFPGVDFTQFVLAPEGGPEDPRLRGDPIWWHIVSPFGPSEPGESAAAISERAWRFVDWLMQRPESDIAVAAHSIFLMALFHGALDQQDGKPWEGPQFLRTGELRSLIVVETSGPPPASPQALAWGAALAGEGLPDGKEQGAGGEGEPKRRRQ